MIKSYKNKETENAEQGVFSRRIPADLRRRLKMRLDRINAAVDVNDLRVPPSHHLEKMSGDKEGQYSIRVNDQFRVCFRFENGNAYDVEFIDYH